MPSTSRAERPGRSDIVVGVEDLDVERALTAAEENGAEAVAPVLESYRARIERMLRLRMDPRVVGRVGVSDVMQDAYIEVARRLPQYLKERLSDEPAQGDVPREAAGTAGGPASGEERTRLPFYLWVRFLASQALAQIHRRHLGTLARDAGRDIPIDGGMRGLPDASSMMLASALVQSGLSPSGAAAAEEQREILSDALQTLSASDREILFLRHFEQLSTPEIGAVLGISSSGASLRHLKALGRLQRALARFGVTFDPTQD